MTPMTDTKTGWLVVIINWVVVQWGSWGSELVDATSTIISMALACVLLYRNILGIKKDKLNKLKEDK